MQVQCVVSVMTMPAMAMLPGTPRATLARGARSTTCATTACRCAEVMILRGLGHEEGSLAVLTMGSHDNNRAWC